MKRYSFESYTKYHLHEKVVYAIYDKIQGYTNPIGFINEALVAQKIVDALNMVESKYQE